MSVVHSDSFSETSLAEYIEFADSFGAYGVSNARLVADGGKQHLMLLDNTPIQDGYVEVDSDQAGDGGLICRFQDNNNYYLLAFRDNDTSAAAGPSLAIFKRQGGSFTNLAITSINFPRGERHTVRFDFTGDTLRGLFDGVEKVSVIDGTFSTAGLAGVRHHDNVGRPEHHYDDLVIADDNAAIQHSARSYFLPFASEVEDAKHLKAVHSTEPSVFQPFASEVTGLLHSYTHPGTGSHFEPFASEVPQKAAPQKLQIVALTRANEANDDYDVEERLFDYTGAAIDELDLAFDQNGAPVLACERPTGTNGAPEVWIHFFDPTAADGAGGFVFENFGPGRTPRVLLDKPIDTAGSEVLVFYASDVQDCICYRQQSDRYATEVTTAIIGSSNKYLEELVRTKDYRLILLYSERDTQAGTYSLQAAHTALYPINMEPEGVAAEAELVSALLNVVIESTEMQGEGVSASSELVSAVLDSVIVTREMTPEGVSVSAKLDSAALNEIILSEDMRAEGVAADAEFVSGEINPIVISREMAAEGVDVSSELVSAELNTV